MFGLFLIKEISRLFNAISKQGISICRYRNESLYHIEFRAKREAAVLDYIKMI